MEALFGPEAVNIKRGDDYARNTKGNQINKQGGIRYDIKDDPVHSDIGL